MDVFLFQAVINENATGDVSSLQNEIKRLKEALQQYSQGASVPSG